MIEAILWDSTGGLIKFVTGSFFILTDCFCWKSKTSRRLLFNARVRHIPSFKDPFSPFGLFLFFSVGDSSRRRTRRVKGSKACSEKGSQDGSRWLLSRSHLLGSAASNPCLFIFFLTWEADFFYWSLINLHILTAATPMKPSASRKQL